MKWSRNLRVTCPLRGRVPGCHLPDTCPTSLFSSSCVSSFTSFSLSLFSLLLSVPCPFFVISSFSLFLLLFLCFFLCLFPFCFSLLLVLSFISSVSLFLLFVLSFLLLFFYFPSLPFLISFTYIPASRDSEEIALSPGIH